MTTYHDYRMTLYDFALQVEEFFNDPSDDLIKFLVETARRLRMDIDEELDNGPDEGTEPDDGDALASAGFGTDEDYGGTDDRL